MKAEAIIIQLQTVIPSLTDLFSDTITLVSITPSGTTATAITSAVHGLATGNITTIADAISPVGITSISRSGTVATVVTTTDHDITEGFQTEATLSGANEAEFNGTFTLLSADNRRTFTMAVVDSGPTTGTGTMLLEDPPTPFGFNGLFDVTVVDPTTFTYTLPQALTEAAVGSGKIHKGIRISGAVNLDRVEEVYTAQTTAEKLWAFVVLEDNDSSRSRRTANDGVNATGTGGDRRQQRISNFSVYTIRKATTELTARDARDEVEELAPFLFKALIGKEFDSGLSGSNGTGVVYVGDGMAAYNTAVYIHGFSFQQLADINVDDGVVAAVNVAFRDIPLSLITNLGTGEDAMTVTVNLDDVPLP